MGEAVPPAYAVSIHAPARGATRDDVIQGGDEVFQSTPPHGERRAVAGRILRPVAVSIHAPARGATRRRRADSAPGSCFNPRPRTGSDQGRQLQSAHRQSFNPRPRTGSDAPSCDRANRSYRFNPRPRTGSDQSAQVSVLRYTQFQSTPPHGERRHRDRSGRVSRGVSIHAPARGATTHRCQASESRWVSIHAPARGSDLISVDLNPF